MTENKHTISLVCTVLNEGTSIDRLLNSIVQQTCLPDEVIFVDGGSRDNTVGILESYTDRLPLRVYTAPGCNISQGRNIGIRAAQSELIAVTDAGVILSPDWLQGLLKPFTENPNTQIVAGFFEADPHTTLEAAMGATVLPLVDEIRPESFLPSSRSVAFRKSAWEVVGGYPEWLDYCEDLVFDFALRDRFGSFVFAPSAIAHFRPRGSLEALYKQYYLYARGDGKADLWRKRHAIRYITYLVGVPLIFALGLLIHPIFWMLYLVGGVFYTYRPYIRLPEVMRRLPKRSPAAWLYALTLIPIIRVVGDVAKMMGYPAGVVWRRQKAQHLPNPSH